MKETILIIEDEALIRMTLEKRLVREGFAVLQAEGGQAGLRMLEEQPVDLVLLDYRLPDMDGLQILGQLLAKDSDLLVIMMTAYSTIENAVQAMRLGAYDYMNKPFNMDAMLLSIRKALETTRLRREVRQLRQGLKSQAGAPKVIGTDPRMEEIFRMVEKVVAGGATTILLEGESGTGKDLLARAIHAMGDRRDEPFMNITCSALPENLLESELFGHEKGAFTDAKEQKKGLLEMAHGGTVFLDEIGEMPLSLQAKLLRFLEEKAFKRVGGTRDLKVNVRIVAATNRDLSACVEAGTFRKDLYYRLKVIPIRLPSLRERRADIPAIVDHFIREFNREFRKRIKGAAPDLLALLQGYAWPGNIRELKNVIERMMILGERDQLGVDDLPPDLAGAGAGVASLTDLREAVRHFERQHIAATLASHQGDKNAAAKALGIGLSSLYRKIEELEIASADRAGAPAAAEAAAPAGAKLS